MDSRHLFNQITLEFPYTYELDAGEMHEIEVALHQVVLKHRLSTAYSTKVFRLKPKQEVMKSP